MQLRRRFTSTFSASSPFARFAFLCLLPGSLAFGLTGTVSAQAIFTVTVLTDAASGVTSHCSNQATAGTLDPNCSLRDALASAAAVNGSSGTTAVTVNFAPSLAAAGNPGTIVLGANALTLPTYTTVQGLTAGGGYTLTNLITIQGNSHIAFSVGSTVTQAALNNLTITNSAPALSTAGVVTVSQCTFSGNATTSGGAIYNAGTLTVLNSTLTGNGALSYGAAIFSTGPNTPASVATTKNLIVSGSTFQGNTSSQDGGAIYIGKASVGSIDSSTFTGNFAARKGGAVYLNNPSGLSRITNSILTGDEGDSECAGFGCNGAGRAFVLSGSVPSGTIDRGTITMTVTLSTGEIIITNQGYGEYSTGDSLASGFGAYITSSSSSLSAQGFGSTLAVVPYSANIVSVVFNNPSKYFTITPVPDAVVSGAGNVVAVGSTAANLSMLGNYGGPTQTILPLPTSAALCAITPLTASGADQRALPRTTAYGAAICQDSGAVQTNYSLAFVQQPSSVASSAFIAPSPSVQLSESGQSVAQANALITVRELSGTLSGSSYSRTDATGVAAFSRLAVSQSQTADVLTATATIGPNTVSTMSNPFPVVSRPSATLAGSGTFPLTGISSASSQLFTFINSGTTTLNISSIAAGPAPEFTQTNTCGMTITAGANCTVSVTFRPSVAGTRYGSLQVVSDASGYTQNYALSGTAASPTAKLTGSGTFANTPLGGASTGQNLTLMNTSAVALAISNIAVTGDFTQTNNCGASLAAGTSCSITVLFKPTVSGTRTGSVLVTTNAVTAVAPVALTGTGVTLSGILTGPATFPATAVGTSSLAQTYTLTNTGTGDLNISLVGTAGAFSQTNQCGQVLAPNIACTFAVVFKPVSSGTQRGHLAVSTNATTPVSPAQFSGVGTVVQASLSGGGVFASTIVGASSQPQAFVLSNTGNDILVLSNIAATGDFSQTNNCGTSLSVGGSCTISALFTPSSLGARSGTLTITSNAKVAIPAATLTGTGVAAPSFAVGDNTSGATTTSITVLAGGTGTGLLKFTSANGFAGELALTCAAKGTAPTGTNCTVTSPVTLAADSTATATVTIATTSRTQTAGLVPLRGRGQFAYLVFLGLLSLFLLRMRSAGQAVRVGGLLMLLLVLGLGVNGCGGTSSAKSVTVVNPNGTPAGTYTYNVTAVSGGVTATQPITVTVQ